jgi:hypothetical protein
MRGIVLQKPQVVAVNKHGINDLAVPFGRVEFGSGEDSVHVVLLKFRPKEGEASADEVVPTDGFLGGEEAVVLRRECGELGHGEVGVIEIGADAG